MRRLRSWALLPPAAVLAAAAALMPILQGGHSALLIAIGGIGLVLYLVGASALMPRTLVWAMVVLALEYVVFIVVHPHTLELASPLFAVLWFLAAEVGWFSLEARHGQPPWLGRALLVAGLAAAGAVVGYLFVLTAAVGITGGLGLTLIGVLAAVGAAGSLTWARRRG
jgi:hypothetical protein